MHHIQENTQSDGMKQAAAAHADQKCRSGIVADRSQRSSFLFGTKTAVPQLRRHACPGGITAQKSEKQGGCSAAGQMEHMPHQWSKPISKGLGQTGGNGKGAGGKEREQ